MALSINILGNKGLDLLIEWAYYELDPVSIALHESRGVITF